MKAGAISSDDLEAAETAVTSAEDALRAAEFAERRAEGELQLARARLAAPSTSGTISGRRRSDRRHNPQATARERRRRSCG